MRRSYRRNYRRGSRRKNSEATLIALAIVIALAALIRYWHIVLPIAAVVGIVALVVYFTKPKKQAQSADAINTADARMSNNDSVANASPIYEAKNSIMTECEKAYFKAIQECVVPNYTVQPQINLASIIDKTAHSRYRNELFRNIDFGIFDANYSLVLLIEINDQTHMKKDRIERDSKVKAICAEAGIPLVTFWTQYGVNKQYIYQRLAEYLPLIATYNRTVAATNSTLQQ